MSYRDHELQDEIDQYNRDGATAQDAPLAEVVDQRMDAILDKFNQAMANASLSTMSVEDFTRQSEHIVTETKRALRDSVIDPYLHEAEGWKKAYFDNVEFQTNAAVVRELMELHKNGCEAHAHNHIADRLTELRSKHHE